MVLFLLITPVLYIYIYIYIYIYKKHWDISLYMQYKPFLLEYGWGKSKVSVNVDKLVIINQKSKKRNKIHG